MEVGGWGPKLEAGAKRGPSGSTGCDGDRNISIGGHEEGVN